MPQNVSFPFLYVFPKLRQIEGKNNEKSRSTYLHLVWHYSIIIPLPISFGKTPVFYFDWTGA